MSSVSFAVGPARIDTQWLNYCREAYEQGILSINHRSDEFHALWRHFMQIARARLNIPNTYALLVTSSATECWHIIAHSLSQTGGLHFFNGQMGEKWFNLSNLIHYQSVPYLFNVQEELSIPNKQTFTRDLVCVTHNETANGSALSAKVLLDLMDVCRQTDALLAVDATSSLGGVSLPMHATDICFASVQKCLGLPAGMGILICSPRAIARAKKYHTPKHYNNLVRLLEHFGQNEAPYTPNVMGIYLLSRILENRPAIEEVDKQIRRRSAQWYACIDRTQTLTPYIKKPQLRSHTVLCLQHPQPSVCIQKAQSAGFPLSPGYGPLKHHTLRIANFPAIQEEEIKDFIQFLSHL